MCPNHSQLWNIDNGISKDIMLRFHLPPISQFVKILLKWLFFPICLRALYCQNVSRHVKHTYVHTHTDKERCVIVDESVNGINSASSPREKSGIGHNGLTHNVYLFFLQRKHSTSNEMWQVTFHFVKSNPSCSAVQNSDTEPEIKQRPLEPNGHITCELNDIHVCKNTRQMVASCSFNLLVAYIP